MDSHGSIKISFRCTHLHRDGKQLRHLACIRPHDMSTDYLLAAESTMSFISIRSCERRVSPSSDGNSAR